MPRPGRVTRATLQRIWHDERATAASRATTVGVLLIVAALLSGALPLIP